MSGAHVAGAGVSRRGNRVRRHAAEAVPAFRGPAGAGDSGVIPAGVSGGFDIAPERLALAGSFAGSERGAPDHRAATRGLE
jgi:hypothetical protein